MIMNMKEKPLALHYSLTVLLLFLCSLRVASITHVHDVVFVPTTNHHDHARPSSLEVDDTSIPPCPNIVMYWIEMSGLNFECPTTTLSTMVTEDIHSSPCIFFIFKLQPLQPKFNLQSNSNYILILLLLAGDTEVNPGPRPIKYPCMVCKKPVKNLQNGDSTVSSVMTVKVGSMSSVWTCPWMCLSRMLITVSPGCVHHVASLILAIYL